MPARGQDLSEILFLENPLLRSFSIEQRDFLLHISEGKKSGNPFVEKQIKNSFDEWRVGLDKRISVIKNIPCKIAWIKEMFLEASNFHVVGIGCASISGFVFQAAIRKSEVPRELLRVGDVMYLSTPFDKIYDSINPSSFGPGFNISVQGAVINQKRSPISKALWREMSLEKCENIGSIESKLIASGYIHDDGQPKCQRFNDRFPDFREILKTPVDGSAEEKNKINKPQQESYKPIAAGYAALLGAKIKSNIFVNEYIDGNPVVEVEVLTSADGTIISQYVIKSSGNKAWDNAAINAVIRSKNLPLDVENRIPGRMIFAFRPRD